jgi:hypothetical protein
VLLFSSAPGCSTAPNYQSGEELSSEAEKVRWISTGRGRGGRRGAEGEEAAGGAGGERVEVAPRGSGGGPRRREQRGVAGGVENQRAARLVRHGRARTPSPESPPFLCLRRGTALYSAGPLVGLSPDFLNTRRGRGPTCLPCGRDSCWA